MKIANANEHILDKRLDPNDWLDHRLGCPDQEIIQELRVSAMAIAEERRRIVLSVINRVGHAYNTAFQDAQIERYVLAHSGNRL